MPELRSGVLILLVAATLSGCAPQGARNVVLVTIDTLRADHLGCYGYPVPTSPRIDALAQQATLYERAMASSPWTVPSHASLFTGLDPFEHGAHSFPATLGVLRNVHPLSPERTTLAEVLAEEGYDTAAFVANAGFLNRSLQLDQGFEVYQADRMPAAALNRGVFEWLEIHRERPFFLFVNYMDAHFPYNTRPRPGQIDPPAPADRGLVEQLFQAVMPGRDPVPRALAERVIAQYDTGIAHADEAVGALIDRLVALGLYEDTVLVVTSDHGEYFGEHQLVGHSKDVYQQALHVPLLVKPAGDAREVRVATPVSSADVAHLIAVELAAPLADRVASRFPASPGELVLAENHYSRARDMLNPAWNARFQRVRRAIYDWPLKYVSSSDGEHELYDLEADADEQTNLVDARSEDAQRLEAILAERLAASAGGGTGARAPEPTAAEVQELRELGYVE